MGRIFWMTLVCFRGALLLPPAHPQDIKPAPPGGTPLLPADALSAFKLVGRGAYLMRGFLGDYEVTVTASGRSKTAPGALTKAGTRLTVTLNRGYNGTIATVPKQEHPTWP